MSTTATKRIRKGKELKTVTAKKTSKNVDQAAMDAIRKHKEVKELELIRGQFKDWCSKSVEELLGERDSNLIQMYDFKDYEYVVRVFDYRPSKADEDAFDLNINSAGDKISEFMHRYFPICRVLAVGNEDGDYKVGDFVKINDFHAMTIDNPHYEHWITNGGNKAKGQEKIGTEPPRLMSNLKQSFGEYMFIVHFVKTKLEVDDYVTFKLPKNKLQNKIKDISIYEQYITSV